MWQCDELLVMTVRCNYLEGVIRGMAMATKGQRDHTMFSHRTSCLYN